MSKKKPDFGPCLARAYPRDIRVARGFPCSRKAVVMDPGGPHCGIHSDAAKARRQAKSDARWAAEGAKAEAKHNARLRFNLLEGLREIARGGDQEASLLASALLDRLEDMECETT